ncbi:DUF4366 domain-containing protein [Candidatus Pacearchaeota archaeon]|nr:DUF4366 domain-containing protein [Candidatus Pacearchaeota archaeon]
MAVTAQKPIVKPVAKPVVKPVGGAPAQPGAAPVEGGKKMTWWMWVIIAIVVLGILGAAWYFLVP